MRVGISSTETRPRGAAGPGPRLRRDGRRQPLRRGLDRGGVRRAGGRARRASPWPRSTSGIKANTPRMMAERGIETHVLPATATLDDVLAVSPDGLFFSNGPGDPAATTGQIELLRGALERGHPVLRHLLRQPALRPGARLRHLQADLRSPRHQPAGHGPHHRQGRGHRAQPRLRGPGAPRRRAPSTPYGEATVSPRLPQRRRGRGAGAAHATGACVAFSVQYHPEAAAGPARRGVPLRPLLRPDVRCRDGRNRALDGHGVESDVRTRNRAICDRSTEEDA